MAQYCADYGRALAPREKILGIPMTEGPRPKVKIASFWQDQMQSTSDFFSLSKDKPLSWNRE